MSHPTFRVKQNDTRVLQSKLEKEGIDGVFAPAFTSSVGVSVVFSMRAVGASTATINRGAVSIVQADSTASIVKYVPTPTDFAVPGEYQCEWEVTDNGKVETYPADGYLGLTVVPDIG